MLFLNRKIPGDVMVALHDAGEKHARPWTQLVSESRAVLSFHARRRYYPEGNIDKVRFIQNEEVPGNILESRFPVLESSDAPVMVTARNAREAHANAWIDGEKEIDDRDVIVKTFALSISCGFAEDDAVDELPSFPGARDWCPGAYKMCNHGPGTTLIGHSYDKHITRIPRCMERYKNLESLNLKNTSVSRIENLDKLVNLKYIGLDETQVNRIENLDKNVNLKDLWLTGTKVSQIENLDKNVNLEYIGLDDTKVSRIEGLENNVKLKRFDLNYTAVSTIENLDKLVNLEILDLHGTKVRRIENLEKNVELEELWLTGTPVSRIENLDTNVGLKKLGLTGTPVSRIENLDTNVKLRSLYLGGTKVPDEEKRAFKTSRRGLAVK